MSDVNVGGRPPWVLTEERKKLIFEAAELGAKEHTIARAIGLAPNTLSSKKNEYPEIQQLIDEGRAHGALYWLQESRKIASSGSGSRAQAQELERMHRMLKVDAPDENEVAAQTPTDKSNTFTIEVVTRGDNPTVKAAD